MLSIPIQICELQSLLHLSADVFLNWEITCVALTMSVAFFH